MASSPTTSSTLLLLLLPVALVLLGTFECCFCVNHHANATACIKREREALLKFKGGLIDQSNLLSSWTGDDCCSWKGVGCSKRTGHVIKLDIRNPCVTLVPLHYDSAIGPGDALLYSPVAGNCTLSGRVHPSLGELRHLRYLDFSWNNFSYSRIPTFLGSLSNLVYLNLSNAAFDGEVPRQIGNLSNLEYLDLGDNIGLTLDNLEWVSGIHSLKHLDLSWLSVRNGEDWMRSVFGLYSLQELDLAHCHLPSIRRTTFPVNITSLEILDLSSNNLGLGVGSFLSEIINNNKDLSFLDLSSNYMFGGLPVNLSNLCHLSSLGLAGNSFTGNISSIIGDLISGCSGDKLKYLDLNFNKFQGHLGEEIGQLKNLGYINLLRNSIGGPIPESLGQLHSLKVLVLSLNQFAGGIPESLGQLHSLNFFDLSLNELNGSIPVSLDQLHSLEYLDLSYNKLTGSIPASLGQLLSLSYFQLSHNDLTGSIPLSLGQLHSLKYLDLSHNDLTGCIPVSLGQLHSLKCLDLSYNNLTGGGIPLSLGQLHSLEYLDLSYNKWTDGFPAEVIGVMSNLVTLMLSGNILNGMLTELQLANLTSLENLDVSYNYELVVNISPTWVAPFQLRTLRMSSCKVGPQFPMWLQPQMSLSELLLLNASIAGFIPGWFPNISFNMKELDLSGNGLIGQIPENLGPNLERLFLSSNQFNGSIPLSLCKAHGLSFVDLSNNQLSGSLPHCLTSLSYLYALNLGNNRFNGQVLTALCSQKWLFFLGLHNNEFHGVLPKCLSTLRLLQFLDLSNNNFAGGIPSWIGLMTSLAVLNLEFNSFNGEIPMGVCQLPKLQVLNLAHSNLSGSIPLCFDNFTAMADPNFHPYFYYPPDLHRGVEVHMKSITQVYTDSLKYLISIDLSNNNLVGEIPQGLTHLYNLQNLNLSWNNLRGTIPEGIGIDLKNLESLDLSMNQLSGHVPPSLAKLDSLGALNLSFNILSGSIPRGNHLDTFTNESYLGNDALCGPPLTRTCSGDKEDPDIPKHGSTDDSDGEDESYILWFYAGIAPGFAVGLIGACSSLYFNNSWRQSFFLWSDNVLNRFLVMVEMTNTCRFRRLLALRKNAVR